MALKPQYHYITFAESEPYCHCILFVCLSVCLSVIPRPTAYHDWSITTKFGRQVCTCPRTRVSLFGSPTSHTFSARAKKYAKIGVVDDGHCLLLLWQQWGWTVGRMVGCASGRCSAAQQPRLLRRQRPRLLHSSSKVKVTSQAVFKPKPCIGRFWLVSPISNTSTVKWQPLTRILATVNVTHHAIWLVLESCCIR